MNRYALRAARDGGKLMRDSLERLILAEPSGEARNALTEANIHLLAAVAALTEAARLGGIDA